MINFSGIVEGSLIDKRQCRTLKALKSRGQWGLLRSFSIKARLFSIRTGHIGLGRLDWAGLKHTRLDLT